MKRFFLILFLGLNFQLLAQETFNFVHLSDIHVGGSTGTEDLEISVNDINQQKDIDFVIITGDITEFGSDDELRLAKSILDRLSIPWHIVPGNHDSNWSESGANSFRKVFGSETFFVRHKGYIFMGTACGPNMRMSPGQVPRENLVWIDSVFAANPDVNTPLIFADHYPLNDELNNWYEVVDRLKTRNTILAICGHHHTNKTADWEGIPGIFGRSNLRNNQPKGGYNIVTLSPDKVSYRTRIPMEKTGEPWVVRALKNWGFKDYKETAPRPDFSVNTSYNHERKLIWEFEDDSDLGDGMASYKQYIITGNTQGKVYALHLKTGRKVWEIQTGGKIYSTPVVWKNTVVVGSSDTYIYGLSAKNGQLKWKVKTDKAVLGSPVVKDGIAFIGGSDGRFRAIDIETGGIKWTFDKVKGYVSDRPLIYQNKVIFGSWQNGFYALNIENGTMVWEWINGYTNRMYSAAACYPVATNNRIFVVAPDRFMTALDAETGAVIWRKKAEGIQVRESMGLSLDQQYVYVKTMEGNVYGVSTQADTMEIAWKSSLQLPYEIAPTNIESKGDLVLVPSQSGLVSAVSATTGNVVWQYKISNGMINPIFVYKKGIVVSAMDGKLVNLRTRFKGFKR